MTDIVERLRALNADFLHEEAADEIERLRAERDALKVECYAVGENYEIAKRGQLSAEIAQLRADLLQAEMQAEMAGLENIMRAVARGRREGIEAALPLLAASDEVLSGLARGECEQFMYAKFAPVVGAFRALLEDGR